MLVLYLFHLILFHLITIIQSLFVDILCLGHAMYHCQYVGV